jgi:hypothetical protein
MSLASLEQFRQVSVNSPELQEQLKSTIDNPNSFVDLAVQLGRQSGYSFTREEVKNLILPEAANQRIEPLTVEDALRQIQAAELVSW